MIIRSKDNLGQLLTDTQEKKERKKKLSDRRLSSMCEKREFNVNVIGQWLDDCSCACT